MILAAGCRSSRPKPVSVTISLQAGAIGTGQGTQFTATTINDPAALAWSATAGTVGTSDNYSAPSRPQHGVKVTATSKKDPTKIRYRNGQRGSTGADMLITGQYAYRGHRIPSFYPGVHVVKASGGSSKPRIRSQRGCSRVNTDAPGCTVE